MSVADNIVRQWGNISGSVKRRTGHSPSVIDTILVATAIQNELFLVTRNTKDVQHSAAAIFNPWDDDPSEFVLA